jgi:hypothetical protein
MTNLQTPPSPARDSAALLLDALVWILSDGDRARRLLSLTGLEPDDLRLRAGDSATLVAVGRFLGDYERDLVACAAALDSAPSALIMATQTLAGEFGSGEFE